MQPVFFHISRNTKIWKYACFHVFMFSSIFSCFHIFTIECKIHVKENMKIWKYACFHVFMFSCFRNMKIWKDICFHVFMFSCCHVLILTCLMCTLVCFISGAPGRSGHLGRLRCLRVLMLPLGFFRLSRVVASFSQAFFRFAVLVFVLNRFAEVWSVHSDSSTTMLRAHSPL